MNQHTLIIKLIDNMDELRPSTEHGGGVCLGLTLTVLISLFAGNLEACEEAFDTVEKLFPDPDHDTVQRRLLYLDSLFSKLNKSEEEKKLHLAFINVIALLSHVVLTQHAYHHRHLFEPTKLPGSNQYESIPATTQMMLFQSSQHRKTKTMAISKSFCAYVNQQSLADFLATIEHKITTKNIRFGCILSIVGHAMGFGYDPDSKTWVLARINPEKIMSRHSSATELVQATWEVFSEEMNERAAHFKVITREGYELKNQLNAFFKRELTKIKHYSIEQLCELYALAYGMQDQYTIDAIFKHLNLEAGYPNLQSALCAITGKDDFSIHSAIKLGSETLMLAIEAELAENNINERDRDGNTPLICAIKSRKPDLAKLILENPNVNVLLTDKREKSAIYYAAFHGYQEVFHLIYAKIDCQLFLSQPTILLPKNLTLLQHAAKFELLEIMEPLIRIGANINESTEDKSTPLHLAAQYGAVKSIRRLLQEPNINVNAINSMGNTPLYEAISNGYVKASCEIMQHLEKSQNLSSYLVHPSKKWTILHCASAFGMPSIMHKMIALGADVNLPAIDQSTPLHLAAMHGKLDAVNILLDINHIDLNATNSENLKPQECETIANQDTIRELIIKANVNRPTFIPYLSFLRCQIKPHGAPQATRKRSFDMTI